MPGEIIRIGFIPLVDCALLAVAQEEGFFARQQVEVELRKAQSWGQAFDKLVAGELDASHLLHTAALQAALDGMPEEPPIVYALTLGYKGNGIILSNALWNQGAHDPASLRAWLDADPSRVLRLGVVFPESPQEYILRTWLGRAGMEVGKRISLSFVAPQEMVGRLRKGEIDGFCVAEPWSRRAAASKLGRLTAESRTLLPGLGDKVLGVRLAWHRSHSLEHARLIRALFQASEWLEDPVNRPRAVEILASKHYVNTPKNVIEGALRSFAEHPDSSGPDTWADFRHGDAPVFPAREHARWYLGQMIRWGNADATVARSLDLSDVCLESFYRSVTSGLPRKAASPAVAADPREG